MKAYRIVCLILLSAIFTFAARNVVQACYDGPEIEIISPENKTYATNSIPLIFTIDKPAVWISWIGYSLDGQENVTICCNTTLTDLQDGAHDVVVYANDTCGRMGVSNKVCFGVDTTPPNITDVSQMPDADNVLPIDTVKVNATVTDNFSGVKQVILNYTTGNGTWITVNMSNLEENVWNGTIPAFEYCTWVNYTIMAEDNVGNTATTEEVYGYQYQYHVIPEFSQILVLLMPMAATLLTALLYKRRKHSL
ncbi:hypothetical protein HXY33_08220 [Candidatus Bathyarchaeota archaeon]|nr:hypothetical protein [Candidatus Bathyarchaeota archaeon]